jgi:hypothetical protein
MANPERGEASLEVDGKVYRLKAGTNMMRALEHHFSTSARHLSTLQIVRLADEGSFTHYCGIIWAMLRKYHADLTMDQVGDLIDAAGGPKALEPIFSELLLSLVADPADLKALGINPQTAQAGDGKPPGIGAPYSRKRAKSA